MRVDRASGCGAVPQPLRLERTRSVSSASGITRWMGARNRVQNERIRLMTSLGWEQDASTKIRATS